MSKGEKAQVWSERSLSEGSPSKGQLALFPHRDMGIQINETYFFLYLGNSVFDQMIYLAIYIYIYTVFPTHRPLCGAAPLFDWLIDWLIDRNAVAWTESDPLYKLRGSLKRGPKSSWGHHTLLPGLWETLIYIHIHFLRYHRQCFNPHIASNLITYPAQNLHHNSLFCKQYNDITETIHDIELLLMVSEWVSECVCVRAKALTHRIGLRLV